MTSANLPTDNIAIFNRADRVVEPQDVLHTAEILSDEDTDTDDEEMYDELAHPQMQTILRIFSNNPSSLIGGLYISSGNRDNATFTASIGYDLFMDQTIRYVSVYGRHYVRPSNPYAGCRIFQIESIAFQQRARCAIYSDRMDLLMKYNAFSIWDAIYDEEGDVIGCVIFSTLAIINRAMLLLYAATMELLTANECRIQNCQFNAIYTANTRVIRKAAMRRIGIPTIQFVFDQYQSIFGLPRVVLIHIIGFANTGCMRCQAIYDVTKMETNVLTTLMPFTVMNGLSAPRDLCVYICGSCRRFMGDTIGFNGYSYIFEKCAFLTKTDPNLLFTRFIM